MQGKHLVANLRFRGVAQVDPAQMRQLLGILLDNACKYTEPGDTVTVTTEARSGRLVLCVADTGCGLSKEERRRAFERFYRADRARSRATGGKRPGAFHRARHCERAPRQDNPSRPTTPAAPAPWSPCPRTVEGESGGRPASGLPPPPPAR